MRLNVLCSRRGKAIPAYCRYAVLLLYRSGMRDFLKQTFRIFNNMNLDAYTYLQQVRGIALALPGVTEGPCHGTPGFWVHKKLLGRIKEDGETLAIRTQEREKWMEAAPDIFFITDHYQNYPMMLIHLAKVDQNVLAGLFLAAWKERAPKKLLQAYEEPDKKQKRS